MGGNNFGSDYFSASQYFERNSITLKDARNIAKDYIEISASKSYTIPEGGHEFYGYYTFHILEKNETVGMLSVNGITGDVWYHDWHGTVSEVIDDHESEEDH